MRDVGDYGDCDGDDDGYADDIGDDCDKEVGGCNVNDGDIVVGYHDIGGLLGGVDYCDYDIGGGTNDDDDVV